MYKIYGLLRIRIMLSSSSYSRYYDSEYRCICYVEVQKTVQYFPA